MWKVEWTALSGQCRACDVTTRFATDEEDAVHRLGGIDALDALLLERAGFCKYVITTPNSAMTDTNYTLFPWKVS